jgi:hypothetical protein
VFIYLKGNIWVEIPDGIRASIIDEEFQCLDSEGRVLARFSAMDVQLYSRIKLRTAVEDDEDNGGSQIHR